MPVTGTEASRSVEGVCVSFTRSWALPCVLARVTLIVQPTRQEMAIIAIMVPRVT